MSTTETISASEFKAKCLNILDRLASHQIDRVVITKRGRPVGILLPPESDITHDLYGSMQSSVIIPNGFDLTKPVLDEPFDAEGGLLHR